MNRAIEDVKMLDWSDAFQAVSADRTIEVIVEKPRANVPGRVSVDEKPMINCRADVNQLLSMKYRWA